MLKRQDVREVTKKVASSIVREGFFSTSHGFYAFDGAQFLDQRIELCGVIDQDSQLTIEQPVIAFNGDVAEHDVLFL